MTIIIVSLATPFTGRAVTTIGDIFALCNGHVNADRLVCAGIMHGLAFKRFANCEWLGGLNSYERLDSATKRIMQILAKQLENNIEGLHPNVAVDAFKNWASDH